jgi:iron-sulfur cluster assembly protein
MTYQEVDEAQGIRISDIAAGEIKSIMKENEIPEEYCLRIGVRGGGCSGLTYSLGFDGETIDGDTTMEVNGVRLVVDPKSLFYLTGAEIDYTSGPAGSGFVFNNPNAPRSCSCGSSTC